MVRNQFGFYLFLVGPYRKLSGVILLIPILLAAASCQNGRQNYLTNGIGSELSAPNLPNTESLQDRYFAYLCRQASDSIVAPGSTCSVSDWNLIAYQGMNDIDRRCDSYLQWLDNRRRSQQPWLSQIGDTAAATSFILTQTDVGTKAISIVGQAFQLLTKSIENYHSRLLLEVESSTVNSIVLQGRTDFREYLRDKKISFRNKPEVEHALRSYIRLCLPFAIESKINNYSTLGANGQSPDKGGTLGDLPVLQSATDSLPQVKNPPNPRNAKTPTEANLTSDQVRTIQKALCVEVDGAWGAATRAAVVEFYNGVGDPRPHIAQKGLMGDDLVKLREAMRASPQCNAPNAHKSAFQLGQLVS